MKVIPLTNGGETLVDDEDYAYLSQWNWRLSGDGYVHRISKRDKVGYRRNIRMHREIMNTPEGMDTDHINNYKLDNRKSNLRICTHQNNLRNSATRAMSKSGYRGVSWDSNLKNWRARIMHTFIGNFETKELAAKAYNQAALISFGEYAYQNKVEDSK